MDYQDLTDQKTRVGRPEGVKDDAGLSTYLFRFFRQPLALGYRGLDDSVSAADLSDFFDSGVGLKGLSFQTQMDLWRYDRVWSWALRRSLPFRISDIQILCRGLLQDRVGECPEVYRTTPLRLPGSEVIFPDPGKIPELMTAFDSWLSSLGKDHPVYEASLAHYGLLAIHPFKDGNGRLARLLMNILLVQRGYPPVIFRPQDRILYIRTLERSQCTEELEDFLKLMARGVKLSLDRLLKHPEPQDLEPEMETQVIRIGKLAGLTGESHATLRHWTKAGLLQVHSQTPVGYHLYRIETVHQVREIRALQKKRFSLEEIKEKLLKAGEEVKHRVA